MYSFIILWLLIGAIVVFSFVMTEINAKILLDLADDEAKSFVMCVLVSLILVVVWPFVLYDLINQ